jgi:hypothetical protein
LKSHDSRTGLGLALDFMNSSDIQIERWGCILAGRDTGSYVFVKDDSSETRGFFIFESKEPSLERSFDSWVKDLDDVEKFFRFAGWEIEWL